MQFAIMHPTDGAGAAANVKERSMKILAELYLARHESQFAAYMALQRALLEHHLVRGGSVEDWCERMAPRFRQRYCGLAVAE